MCARRLCVKPQPHNYRDDWQTPQAVKRNEMVKYG